MGNTASSETQVQAVMEITLEALRLLGQGQCLISNFAESLGGGSMRYDCKPAANFPDCFLFQFIEDLPEENAVCELDCRKHLCTEHEWAICRRRLSRSAAELMPHDEANA